MQAVPRLDSDILGFNDLFLGRLTPPGFRFGSTLLIAGPPGAGKSTFALALARSLLVKQFKRWKETQVPGSVCSRGCKKGMLYLISLESTQQDLESIYEQTGWFSEDGRGGPTEVFQTRWMRTKPT